MRTSYAIALGSNQPHARFGRPEAVLQAACAELAGGATRLIARSPIIRSAPIGPSLRTYANAAALIDTGLEPLELLAHLKSIEAAFGRRIGGQRWRARVLDLDILLWSEGAFEGPGLCIPHIEFAQRRFVLDPLARIAGNWRDPRSGLTIYHLKARLDRKPPAA
ncbi:MAG: 2-amino-4-hydroxy-6-hydroxymethyldihydropteridine diphosphokinase [Pseudomonadota bacterium]|jgi:2-amino-4-hydroxy-6-hydroxymethyldihydropteridine diphosphokinase